MSTGRQTCAAASPPLKPARSAFKPPIGCTVQASMVHAPLRSPAMIILAMLIAMYFIPSIIAAAMRHRQTPAIFAFNLFLGWTFFGWVAAFVWALIRPAPDGRYYR